MRKFFLLILLPLLLLLSCSREGVQESYSLIGISSEALGSKVQFSEGKTVWNCKDRVGVFFEDGAGEQWTYLGEDGAASGNIGGITHHSLSEKKRGLYPYSKAASLSGRVITTSINGGPVLVADSADDELHFSYACACLALRLSGSGSLKQVKLKSGAGEPLCGAISIDEDKKVSLVSGDADSVTKDVEMALTEEKTLLCFYLPPVSLSEGFSVEYRFSDDSTLVRRFSLPASFSQGVMYIYDDALSHGEQEIWDFDFRSGDILGLGTTYRVYNDSTGFIGGKTFTTSDGKELSFYTIDRDNDKGTLGVRYYSPSKDTPGYIQIGRAGSWIRFPGRDGWKISGAIVCFKVSSYTYYSSAPDGYSSISPRYGSIVPGEDLYIPLSGLQNGEPCYQMVYTKMASFYRIQIIYTK